MRGLTPLSRHHGPTLSILTPASSSASIAFMTGRRFVIHGNPSRHVVFDHVTPVPGHELRQMSWDCITETCRDPAPHFNRQALHGHRLDGRVPTFLGAPP